MGTRPTLSSAVAAIERQGALLVYPIDNRPAPPSLWSAFHPRTPMRWEWDADGDDRVSELWHLREELSRSGRVVYAKWFRGRATFFARDIFVGLLAALESGRGRPVLSGEATRLLQALEQDSPLSTKQLKATTDLRGAALSAVYERAMKELWARGLIVGYGEVDEGAFPSLAVGATRLLFEDLWDEACGMGTEAGRDRLHARLPKDSLFLRAALKPLGGRPSRCPRPTPGA